jgi:hypothetical protein
VILDQVAMPPSSQNRNPNWSTGQGATEVLGQLGHLPEHHLGHGVGVVALGQVQQVGLPYSDPVMIVNRVERSTRVPTATPPAVPITRSPSQWPGTARSATSAGRWLILNASR